VDAGGVIVVDEVQKAPQLLEVVHLVMERRKDLRFVLTGSSSRKLKRGGVDLLAGRALLRHMHPFMAAELGASFDFESAMTQGLLPVVWDAERPRETLRAYVALYVREEVQLEGMVRRVDSFARFLEVVSFSHASVVNASEIARECAVSRKTVESYIEILEDLLLAFRIPVFSRRAARQLTSHPKLYWFDAGVYRSMRPAGPLDRPEEIAGACLEGLVAQHLRAWIDYTDPGMELSFWRTKSGLEVDFVVYGQAGLWAIEVKHAATIRGKDLRALQAFSSEYPQAKARLVYRGNEALKIDGIRCVPCDAYLSAIRPGQPLP